MLSKYSSRLNNLTFFYSKVMTNLTLLSSTDYLSKAMISQGIQLLLSGGGVGNTWVDIIPAISYNSSRGDAHVFNEGGSRKASAISRPCEIIGQKRSYSSKEARA